MSDKIDFDDSGDSNYSGHKGTIPVCIIKSTNDGKLTMSTEILEEEVPTKVPQPSLLPKKSAMKKPRVENNTAPSNSNSNGATTNSSYANNFRSSTKTNSSYSKHEATHKVSFPELKSVIKGLKSNPNSVQCKWVDAALYQCLYQCDSILIAFFSLYLNRRNPPIAKERNPSIVSNSDSDSDDGDSLAKLRDYYGDDEQGMFGKHCLLKKCSQVLTIRLIELPPLTVQVG